MIALYNEIDPYAAQWLRNLIAAGHIAPGIVNETSIVELQPSDVAGFTQVHFFAGIGGWSLAARLAGWPDDRPLWTGSCPCQPFSVAGKRTGFADKRHLWPEFKRLIAECKPSTIFGEQSARAADWLALVRSDLETLDYAVGAMPIEAASAGADHFRDRYWFVADSDNAEWRTNSAGRHDTHGQETQRSENAGDVAECSARAMVHPSLRPTHEGWTESEFRSRGFTAAVTSFCSKQFVECPDGKWRALPPPRVRWLGDGIPARVAKLRGFGNAIDPRPAAVFIGAYLDCQPA